MFTTLYKNIIIPFVDFIYPSVCFLCNKRIDTRNEKICKSCWSSFTKIDDDHPAYIELKDRLISSSYIKNFIACYLFEKEGKFQEAVHLLKYVGIKSIGIKLGQEIGKKILNTITNDGRINFIVPIPLHKLKNRERGYNQSDYLCGGISDIINVDSVNNLLIRKINTKSQTVLNFQARKLNVSDAFELNPKYNIKGENILLVDDVVTTGATIEAAAKVLFEAGAHQIYAASAGAAKGIE